MMTDQVPFNPNMACTLAVRHHLSHHPAEGMAADLLFLERWEMSPAPGAGPPTLRPAR